MRWIRLLGREKGRDCGRKKVLENEKRSYKYEGEGKGMDGEG